MPKRTLLDRELVILLPREGQGNAVDKHTPSRKQGISAAEERLHRLHGVLLMEEACLVLGLNDNEAGRNVFSTASTIFHRFFHQESLTACDVWSVAMAAVGLASKIEECVVSFRNVILTFVHLYRKRYLCCYVFNGDEEEEEMDIASIAKDSRIASAPSVTSLSQQKRYEILSNVPPLSMYGPVWKEWHDTLVQSEARLLRQLGFVLHWIPNHKPHRLVADLVTSCLVLSNAQVADTITSNALRFCEVACRMDLLTRFRPNVIGCAAIYLAVRDHASVTNRNTTWWRKECGDDSDSKIASIANAILGAQDKRNPDFCLAAVGFIKSRVVKGSFNDPESFLFEQMVESIQ